MTWSISVTGDDAFGDENDKAAYENNLVQWAVELVDNISRITGSSVATATITTDTTGTIPLINIVGDLGGG